MFIYTHIHRLTDLHANICEYAIYVCVHMYVIYIYIINAMYNYLK